MKRGHKHSDPDTTRGIATALGEAFGLIPRPLLIDAAGDAAFASSIERLRGVKATRGKNHD